MQIPRVVFIQAVFAVRPPNAEPLLFAAEVNAYRTSVNPCGPGLEIDTFSTDLTNVDPAVKPITSAGMIRM